MTVAAKAPVTIIREYPHALYSPPDAEQYAIFRCVECECVNVAWEGTEKYNTVVEEGKLRRSIALCTNASCKCHTTGGGRVQGKSVYVGKDPPWN